MTVEYNNNNISINLSNTNREQSISVYAHPNDKLSFNIDISSLRKEIIKGDLVIHLLNGSTVTVVNFGLMSLDSKAPVLTDSTGTEYNPLSLFQGTAYFSSNGVDSYIVSRQVSSPEDNASVPGNKYRTAKDVQDGSGLEASKSGYFPVEDQNPVPEFGPSFEDYVQKTLMNLGAKNNISDTDFSSTKGFKYTDKSDNTKPVKLLIINPKLTPEYGAQYSMGEKNPITSVSEVKVNLGGGNLQGTDYAFYQYTPEKVVINAENAVLFDGPTQTDTITRYVTIYIDNKLVRFTGVTISGLPTGVTIPSGNSDNLSVNPAGAGGYQIDITGGSANGEVRIPFQYKIGQVGDESLFGALDVSYDGVLSTTGDIVRGSSVFYFNFLPVQGERDMEGGYNTYTYSTLRDPLEIVFPNYNNEIRGGKGNYTYVGGSGDDTAIGGEATETFNLGSGNNTFYAGLSNDTVTNSIAPGAINKLYLSDAINKADPNSTKVVIDNGLVYFSGKNFESTMSNFTDLYLDINRYGAATEREDNIIINSTKLLNGNVITHFGDGDNTVTLGGDIGFEITFLKNDRISQNELPIYVSTKNSTAGVFFDWDGTKNSKNWLVGSKPGDNLVFDAGADAISYDASGSKYSTANYSNLLGMVGGDFNFDASTCEVSRTASSGVSITDKLLGIREIIGDSGQNNLFFGALSYEDRSGVTHYSQINYIGGNPDESKNVLSYEKMISNNSDDISNNGVTINMEARTVEKHKNTAFVDTFENIGSVVASDNSDIIIAANKYTSSSLDGKGGDNTISYELFSSNIIVEISDYSGTSSVYKGSSNSGFDTLKNFNHFIGSEAQTDFILDGSYDTSKALNSRRYELDGGAALTTGGNSVSYKNVYSVNMMLDLNINNVMLASFINSAGDTIFYDQLSNIGSFTLSSQSSNTIYMYEQSQLSFLINAGNSGTNNVITFEKSQQSIHLDFKNDSYNNITNVNKLLLSDKNDTVVMGFNFFAQEIDGGKGINLIDLSILNSVISQDFDLDNIGLDNLTLGGSTINVRNFQRVVSGSGDDVYSVKANLDNIDLYAAQEFFIDGGLGDNEINFEKVSHTASGSEGLNIDLSKYLEDGAFATYSNSSLISFKNFSNIIGSNYDDVFIIPDYDFVFTIDGGLGTNTVSYQSYENGVFITRDTLSKFKNIQKIIGSQGNDKISLDETSSLNVDGGNKGFNTALYSGIFNTVTNLVVNYSNNIALITKDSNVDTLINIQHYNFKSISDGGALKAITVNIKDPLIGDRPVFFSAPVNTTLTNGGVANLEYSAADSFENNVNLNLSLNSSSLAEGNWISLKGLNATEESINFQNFSSIIMTGYMSIAVTDYTSLIVSLQDIKSLTLDNTKDLHNALDLQAKTGDVTITNNVFSEKYNSGNFSLNINKIGKIIGSNDLNSTLNYIGVNPDYKNTDSQFVVVVAGMGTTNIDYRNIKGELNININYNTEGKALANVSATSGSDTVKINELYGDITKYFLSNSVNNTINFNLKEDENGVTFDGGKFNSSFTNKVSYSGTTASNSVYYFNITGDGNISVSRYYGNSIDNYINFYDVSLNLGTSKVTFDDTLKNVSKAYNIRMDAVGSATDIKIAELDLSDFSGDLNFEMTSSQTAGLLNIINGGSTKASLNFDTTSTLKRSEITFTGSSTKVNTFTLGNFFDGVFTNINSSVMSLVVQGNNLSGNDNILDLRTYSSGISLSAVDGLINAVGNSNLYINAKSGIQTIRLGDGDNILDISSNSNVDWSNIIGGKGSNSVSFANLQAPIAYNLAEGFNFGSSKITLTNFNGIIGTQFNDTFSLQDNKNNIAGVNIDGGGGSRDTLDYSNLSIALEINTTTGKVIRRASSGDITDSVKNIDVFMGGTGGSKFISDSSKGIYSFIGNISAINSSKDNILEYQGSASDRLVFNFVSNSVAKSNGDYDNFSNINKFYGGIGQNIFMFKSAEFVRLGIKDIYLYGDSSAVENSLDFSQEDFNPSKPSNITFTIESNTIKLNSSTTLHLNQIYNITGTRGIDTYVFGDKVDKYTVSGINNDVGLSDIIKLNNVTSKVTVDFKDLKITYGSNTNYFVQIGTFYGSDKAENNFLNLDYFSVYKIIVDSKNSLTNTVSYQEDTPLSMSLGYDAADKHLVLTKSGSKYDYFENIKAVNLSNGINNIKMLYKDDLEYFFKYMKSIDLGKSGRNALSFSAFSGNTVSNFTVDLKSNAIIANLGSGNTSYANTITNFNVIQFGKFSTVNANYIPKVIFDTTFGSITSVSFNDFQKGSLDLSNISSSLNVSIGNTKEVTFTSLVDSSVLKGNRVHDVNLGAASYNINYSYFGNSVASNLKIDTSRATSTTISLMSLDTRVNTVDFIQSSNIFSMEAKSGTIPLAKQEYTIVSRLNINQALDTFNFITDLSRDFYLSVNTIGSNKEVVTLDLTNKNFSSKEITFNVFLATSKISAYGISTVLTTEILGNNLTTVVNVKVSTNKATFKFNELPQLKYNVDGMSIKTLTLDFGGLGNLSGINQITITGDSSGANVDVDLIDYNGSILYSSLSAKVAANSSSSKSEIYLGNNNNNRIVFNDIGAFAFLHGSMSNIYSNEAVVNIGINKLKEKAQLNEKGMKTIDDGNSFKTFSTLDTSPSSYKDNPLIQKATFKNSSAQNLTAIEVKPYQGLNYVDFGSAGSNSANRADKIDFEANSQYNIRAKLILGATSLSGIFTGETTLEIENFNYLSSKSNSSEIIFAQDASKSVDNISLKLDAGIFSLYDLFKNSPDIYFKLGYANTDNNRSSKVDLSTISISSGAAENAVAYIHSNVNGSSSDYMELSLLSNHNASSYTTSNPKILLTNLYTISLQVAYANKNNNGALVIFDAPQSKTVIKQNVDLGDMSKMELPSTNTFFISNTPTSWTRPSSTSDLNKYQNYTGYYNIFEFKGYFNELVTGSLFKDNSNSSVFTTKASSKAADSTYNIRGANLFWGPEGASSNISINKVENAHHFAVLLYDSTTLSKAITNTVDFNDLTDAGSYRFYMGQGIDKTLRGSSLQVLISKENSNIYKDTGVAPSSDDYYGTISGFTNLTLTFGNDVFVPTFATKDGNITIPLRYYVDGNVGLNTLNFYSDPVENDTITFSGSASDAGIRYNNMTFINFKEIITPGLLKVGSSITYKVDFGSAWAENTTHNFIIKHGDSGAYRDINFIGYNKTSQFTVKYVFINEKNIFISNEDYKIQNQPSFLFSDLHINQMNFDSANIVLSNQLDINALNAGSNSSSTTIEASGQGVSRFIELYYDPTNSNYSIIRDKTSFYSKSIQIVDTFGNSLKLNTNNGFHITEISPKTIDSNNISQADLDYLYGMSNESTNYASDVNYSGSSKFNDEGYKVNTNINGSSNIVWKSENKYIEKANHYYANEDYWNSVDTHIDKVVSSKEASKPYMNAFLEEFNKQQNEKVQNASEDSKNKDSHSIDKEDHNVGNDTNKDNDKQNKDSHSNHNNDHFDLNAILQAAKDMHSDSYKNDNNVIESLGFKNISPEVLEDTYKQDESNSMGYTIDTSYNFHDSYDVSSSGCTSHDNQKNKIDHH